MHIMCGECNYKGNIEEFNQITVEENRLNKITKVIYRYSKTDYTCPKCGDEYKDDFKLTGYSDIK